MATPRDAVTPAADIRRWSSPRVHFAANTILRSPLQTVSRKAVRSSDPVLDLRSVPHGGAQPLYAAAGSSGRQQSQHRRGGKCRMARPGGVRTCAAGARARVAGARAATGQPLFWGRSACAARGADQQGRHGDTGPARCGSERRRGGRGGTTLWPNRRRHFACTRPAEVLGSPAPLHALRPMRAPDPSHATPPPHRTPACAHVRPPHAQSIQAAKLCDELASLADEKPVITYPELMAFIKLQ